MDFSEYINSIVSFAQNHTVIAILLALGLLFFIYRKPKLFLGIVFIGLFLVGLFYALTKLTGTGLEQKKRMIPQEEKQVESNRRTLSG